MDYFDSNFNENDQYDQESELPEDFGWEDMKSGVYEKMETTNLKKKNWYWPLLLLLLLIGCGGGSWFTFDYFSGKKSATKAVSISQEEEKERNKTAENIQTKNNTLKENGADDTTEQNSTQLNLTPNSIADTKKKTPKVTKAIAPNTKTQNTTIKNSAEEVMTNEPNEFFTLNPSADFDQNQKNKTADDLNITTVPVLSKVWTNINELPSRKSELIKSQLPNFPLLETPKSSFSKQLSFGLAGGVINWIAFDANNTNHEFVSGFPSYNINPSISFSLTPKHAIQMDYEYSVLEELFDYEGSHAIEVPKDNETVEQVFSSLTGNVIAIRRQDVVVNGTRNYRELKYNKYKLHTLSLGYRFDQITMKKSSFGLYMGASYLLQINGKGKRLDDQQAVVSFDHSNPLFQKNQLGVRFGVHYNYQLNENVRLFSQVISTKYITNWELENSNSATRPLLYRLQIGFRYNLIK